MPGRFDAVPDGHFGFVQLQGNFPSRTSAPLGLEHDEIDISIVIDDALPIVFQGVAAVSFLDSCQNPQPGCFIFNRPGFLETDAMLRR